MRYYVIPNLKEKEKYIELSKKYNLGFEYNEFFIPDTRIWCLTTENLGFE